MKKITKNGRTKSRTTRKPTRNDTTKHEIVVRVQSNPMNLPAVVPTETELMEPMRDGKKLTIPKTWLSDNQIQHILQRTPAKYIYERPGKAGMKFKYVTGSYMEKSLNFLFGWNWDIEVVQEPTVSEVIQLIETKIDQVWVTDKLTVRSPDGRFSVTKTQSGQAEIKFLRDTRKPLNIGNDIKAAHTDALKKCASLLGIASDIYGTSEYKNETGNDPRKSSDTRPESPPPSKAPDGPVEELYCHGAGKGGCPEGSEISRAGHDYSMKLYGKPLCRECAKRATPIKKK
jgi:hypothetical protein